MSASDNKLTIDGLRGEAFDGFVTFEQLRKDANAVPLTGGVYIVARQASDPPAFLAESCGGHFKGRNPTELVDALESKWVPDAEVLYIGKGDVLRRRVKQYASFGAGRPIGHWGGRYIWQLPDSDQLIVAWKACDVDETPGYLEGRLATRFKQIYGRLPFANIVDPSGTRVAELDRGKPRPAVEDEPAIPEPLATV